MRVRRLTIQNFRGAREGTIDFATGHTLLVGGNNVGKSTVCEALDLVLGPERTSRRPVIDEHDFFCGRYLTVEGKPVEIQITAILTDLTDETRNRFYRHLRPWNDTACEFVDQAPDAPVNTTGATLALPVTFIGRYDKAEDDFAGNTFFDHPIDALDEDEQADTVLGGGRRFFGREQKRLCGFIYLRAHRTGARALSLQRGSLLDTILRIGGNTAEMWEATLKRLYGLDPSIGEITQLKKVRDELESRMSRFIKLAGNEKTTSFFASELTREHLREVVSLFIATHPDQHLLPFQRLGTGSLNVLVFALLTFIAELKEKQTAIFAMEEPEIALPPHTQRRVTRFALAEMGQVIATSHSPYVIEQFDPDRVVILDRQANGKLSGRPALGPGLAPKPYRRERKQFAEALLAQAVLVVEGGTEATLFPAASAVLETALGAEDYTHIDLAGVTVFNAGSGGAVPTFGPVFEALQKKAFAFVDTPKKEFNDAATSSLDKYAKWWKSPTKGVEQLLADETAVAAQRRFLQAVKDRDDYPEGVAAIGGTEDDAGIRTLTYEVLVRRKGPADAYAALLIEHCASDSELPDTIRTILITIHEALRPSAALSTQDKAPVKPAT